MEVPVQDLRPDLAGQSLERRFEHRPETLGSIAVFLSSAGTQSSDFYKLLSLEAVSGY